MTDSQPVRALITKYKTCGLARLVGIIGLFIALWFLAYAVQAIPENPKVIQQIIFMGIMMLGSLFDCVRIRHEGLGGLIVLIGGIVFYLYLLIDFILLKQFDPGSHLASFTGTLFLFLAGFLFYSCGRRRNKDKVT
jgi:hypothetical protein